MISSNKRSNGGNDTARITRSKNNEYIEDVQMEITSTQQEEDNDQENEMEVMKDKLTYYVTIKVTMRASNTFMKDLKEKYQNLFEILLEGDPTISFKSVNPRIYKTDLKSYEDIPNKMTAINNYFYTSNRPPKRGTGTMWVTAHIQT